jgi:hypothetical protein
MKEVSIAIGVFILLGISVYIYNKNKYSSSKHPLLDQVRENFRKLDPKFANIPLKSGDSAYTENKEVITLCLVDPETGKEYGINTIMYVAIHELAHVVSKTQGHGEEFRKNFANLLRQSASLGIYDPRKPIPVNYCKIPTGA